jgi:type IV fimbrial biogenesis protein FimT
MEVGKPGRCASCATAFPNHGRLHYTTGFTLVELLVILAMLVILTGFAAPSFNRLLATQRVTGEVNRFVGTLHRGRSEAILRNQRVVICQQQEDVCASTGGWQHGWISFADTNRNGVFDGSESLLHKQPALHPAVTVTSGRRSRIVFQPDGVTPGTNATFTVCHRQYPELARAVIISNVGRVRTARKGPGGRTLNCP